MRPELFEKFLGPAPTVPAFSILNLAVMATRDEAGLDMETLMLMQSQVEAGAFAAVDGEALWPLLSRGLMGQVPSRMLRALHDCGALSVLLPEVAALSGVPQSADDPPQVDIGAHLLRVVDQAARRGAPLAVRFAALVMNVGKADSPPEHLPAHYRHMERGGPRIAALCARLGVPPECRDLALLGLAEVERVHRAARMRAGSMAAMLERVDAFGQPGRFEQLLQLCTCDFDAYPRRTWRRYDKADMLRACVAACAGVAPDAALEEDDDDDVAGRLLEARARVIARALRSERWADPADRMDAQASP
jgi:tRNA nucleotidyltransferase (CCA-adding enzyme)